MRKIANFAGSIIIAFSLLIPYDGAGASNHISPLAVVPSSWQTTATGLSTTQNSMDQTAGLGYVVTVNHWPSLTMRGGVRDAGAYVGPRLIGPIGIDLGQISVTGASASLTSQTTDWAGSRLSFGAQMQLYVSRMSSAIAVQSNATSLSLFTGNLPRYTIQSNTITHLSDGAVYPKYVAYSSGGTNRVKTLSSNSLDLTGADANWVLIWYGNNSHFVDTRRPLSYDWTLTPSDAYRGDVPQLLVFKNKPTSIKTTSAGGVEVDFSTSLATMAILPLDGRLTRSTTETESWASGLPSAISQKVSFWVSRLCDFPLSATETYSYNPDTDTASVNENFTFLSIYSGGIRFAPLPPFLAIARESLPISFSGNIQDGNLNGEFGPSQGIDNVQSYSWSMSGLRAYTDYYRVAQSGNVPDELQQRLNTEVQKVISSGHYAPWVFLDAAPVHRSRGDLYWANPADVIMHLVEIANAVDNVSLKNSLIEYITAERNNYPPETVYNLAIDQGTIRGPFSFLDDTVQYYWDPQATAEDTRQDAFLKNVPLYSFYALSQYFHLKAETPSTNTWQKALETLDRDMQEQDWATNYWFANYQDRAVAVVNNNRHIAGMIGFIRLAQSMNDTNNEHLGRSLLLKAVMTRAAMAHYPRYLGETQLVQLPGNPDWLMQDRSHPYIGYLYNYSWSNEGDDPRQMVYLNQFSVDLNDYNYLQVDVNYLRDDFTPRGQESPYLVAFRDMVPEVGHLIKDYFKQDTEIVVQKVEALYPQWYAAFTEGTLGWEHNLSHPVDSFEVYNAEAWIMSANSADLGHYADISWLADGGDFFYMQKLADAIKAYRGVDWYPSRYILATCSPRDRKLIISWQLFPDQGEGLTWRITVNGPSGQQVIDGLQNTVHSYLLDGLTNYQKYTIVIQAIDSNGKAILSSPAIIGIPTDVNIFLPVMQR